MISITHNAPSTAHRLLCCQTPISNPEFARKLPSLNFRVTDTYVSVDFVVRCRKHDWSLSTSNCLEVFGACDMESRHYPQGEESPLKRVRLGPLRECQPHEFSASPGLRKRGAGCEAPMCLELSSRGSSPPMCPAGKLQRTDSPCGPVDSLVQQSREGARDMYAATSCVCCGVAYQTLERRGAVLPDYEPYCQYCMWANVGLVCRGCCRGGAMHP